MAQTFIIKSFLEEAKKIPVLDVRSPGEYEKGHIPGAVSFPLFSNDERKIVGIIYKKHGRKSAIRKGFEIVGEKYGEYLKKINEWSEHEQVCMYCWRGGMRSGALAWLFERQGKKVILLKGGYKSFRRYLREYFAINRPLNILGGLTGSGKTETLQLLREMGEAVVDLEAISGHRGSAFGNLGFGQQPGNEQFENDLFNELRNFSVKDPVWLENESRSIGRVIIPPELYSVMRKSVLFFIEADRETRIRRIVRDYGSFPPGDLISSIQRIHKKLGGQRAQAAIESVNRGDYSQAVDIILEYYDKTYQYGLEEKCFSEIHYIRAGSSDLKVVAENLRQTSKKQIARANYKPE